MMLREIIKPQQYLFILFQELDRYEEDGIDDAEIEEDLGARHKAEKMMQKRDKADIIAADVDEYLDDDLS